MCSVGTNNTKHVVFHTLLLHRMHADLPLEGRWSKCSIKSENAKPLLRFLSRSSPSTLSLRAFPLRPPPGSALSSPVRLLYLLAISTASLLGGGTVKHTDGTMASLPPGLMTFHLARWELLARTHSSSLKMVIWGGQDTGVGSGPSEERVEVRVLQGHACQSQSQLYCPFTCTRHTKKWRRCFSRSHGEQIVFAQAQQIKTRHFLTLKVNIETLKCIVMCNLSQGCL